MKYYLWILLLLITAGSVMAGQPLGPEQYAPPQSVAAMPIEDGLTWAQIFYYVGGGLAAVALAVKTVLVVLKKRQDNG